MTNMQTKDLYSRKDSNLVFSRFISRGEVLCYNGTKINEFILKCVENSQENQPMTPKFVLYIVYILHYTKQSLDLPIQVQWKSFFDFFLYHPSYTENIKKSTVDVHTSKNILKMIKQRNQSCQVLFYISNTHLYTLVCRFHVNKEVY